MPTKKKVKTVNAEQSKRAAFALYEELQDYFYSWACDGEFFIDDMVRAKAAFDTMDVTTLIKLCAEYRTNVEFTEPDEALRDHLPKMKPFKLGKKTVKFTMNDYTLADRERILSATPGTRAYGAAQIAAQGGGTPFDD